MENRRRNDHDCHLRHHCDSGGDYDLTVTTDGGNGQSLSGTDTLSGSSSNGGDSGNGETTTEATTTTEPDTPDSTNRQRT